MADELPAAALEFMRGATLLLMSIDSRLQEIARSQGGEDDEEEDDA